MSFCINCLNSGTFGCSDGRRHRANKVPGGPTWLRFCVCAKGQRMKAKGFV